MSSYVRDVNDNTGAIASGKGCWLSLRLTVVATVDGMVAAI